MHSSTNCSGGTDRACALVGGAMLDAGLEVALKVTFVDIANDSFHSLFRSEVAPFSSLANKLKVAAATGLISPANYRALTLLKNIRNAFAHSPSPLSFDDPVVANECRKLPRSTLEDVEALQGYKINPLRKRYAVLCSWSAHVFDHFAAERGQTFVIFQIREGSLPTLPEPS